MKLGNPLPICDPCAGGCTLTPDLIESIRDRTRSCANLGRAHHFLFDLRLNRPSRDKLGGVPADLPPTQFVVMGFNPAEGDAWQKCEHTREPEVWHGCEETSEKDGLGLEARRAQPWSARIFDFCQTWDVVQSEFFFWSSHNTGKHFNDRFKASFLNSEHLEFCRDLNLQLIAHHKPRAVIVPGLGLLKLASMYGLEVGSPIARNGRRGRLIVPASRDGVPWIFTRHWTGARLSRDDKAQIRRYLASI